MQSKPKVTSARTGDYRDHLRYNKYLEMAKRRSLDTEEDISNNSPLHNISPLVVPQLAEEFEFPPRLHALLSQPRPSRNVQLKYAWNPADKSENLSIKEDDELTCVRRHNLQHTDCIRGKVPFQEGIHAWEIKWPLDQRGDYAVVGVAEEEACLSCEGAKSLVGWDYSSWGWDIVRNKLYHNAKKVYFTCLGVPKKNYIPRDNDYITYPDLLNPKDTFEVPEKFIVVLDMDTGTLSFVVNGQYLGVAFNKLDCRTLYPIINTTFGNSEITMKYIGGLEPEWWEIEYDKCILRRKRRKFYS